MTSLTDPYSSNSDGSAKDPAAFQKALLADSEKMKALESEPEVLKVVQGQDLQAFQELLKTVFAVSEPHASSSVGILHKEMSTRCSSCTLQKLACIFSWNVPSCYRGLQTHTYGIQKTPSRERKVSWALDWLSVLTYTLCDTISTCIWQKDNLDPQLLKGSLTDCRQYDQLVLQDRGCNWCTSFD